MNLTILSILSLICMTLPVSATEEKLETPFKFSGSVELDASNHIVLRGPVTDGTVSRLIVNMSKVHHDDIVLYITSPGGSVMAGQNLIQQINYLQSVGRKVYCIADVAASMAFAILQECDERYVTPSSILMQHQMSVGMHGQYFNVKSRQQLLDDIEEDLTQRQAKRMGITEEEFTKKTTSDWWFYGRKAVQYGAADSVVQVGCHQDLLESTVQDIFYVETFLGEFPVKVTFSACPLAREPLEVNVGEDEQGLLLNAIEKDQLMREIREGLSEQLDSYNLGHMMYF